MALPEDKEIITPRRVVGEMNLLMIELSQLKEDIKIVTCQRDYNGQMGYFRITPECHQEMLEKKGYYLFAVFDGTTFTNGKIIKACDLVYTRHITWTFLMTEVIL